MDNAVVNKISGRDPQSPGATLNEGRYNLIAYVVEEKEAPVQLVFARRELPWSDSQIAHE